MNKKAAAIIYTREKYIGFPSGFAVQPCDFTKKEETALINYVHDAMNNAVELRSLHKCAKVMIRQGQHIILGVVTFLRDIAKDGWEASDKGNRLVYGFFGYVWHKDDFEPHGSFPDIGNFSELLETWIRPHWLDSPNSKWADMPHLSNYEYDVNFPDGAGSKDAPSHAPEMYTDKTIVISSDREDEMLLWGMKRILQDSNFSLCTNMCVYSARDFSSHFQYAVKLEGLGEKSDNGYGRIKSDEEVVVAESAGVITKNTSIIKKSTGGIPDKYSGSKSSVKNEGAVIAMVVGVIAIVVLLLLLIANVRLPKALYYVLIILSGITAVASLLFLFGSIIGKKNTAQDAGMGFTKKTGKKDSVNQSERSVTGWDMPSNEPKKKSGDNRDHKEAPSQVEKNRKETTEDIFSL